MTKDKNNKPTWLSQHNNVNILNLLSDVERYSSLRHIWEGNYHGKKYIQIAKNEFKNKKGTFGERLMQKLHAKKSMTYMTGSSDKCDCTRCLTTNP